MTNTARRKIGKAVTETLEGRQLYSTVNLNSDGLLTLALDKPGRVIVQQTAPGHVWAYAEGVSKQLRASSISSIKVVGSDGADSVFIDSRLTTPTEISLGAGNDTLRGSGGDDIVYGGYGDDTIYARGGDDLVDGGEGNDTIFGGEGNDSLFGGAGTDKLNANSGVNKVYETANAPSAPASPAPTSPAPTNPTVGNDNTDTPATGDDTNDTPAPGNNQNTDNGQNNNVDPTPTAPTTPVIDEQAPVVKVNFISNTVAAGQSIHADGLDTQLKNGTILTAKFEWTFGDGSNQKLTGWNVAHLYEKAGTYDMTLTVTDEAGHQTVHTESVTITAAQRKVIYVSANGNDSNDGLTQNTAIKSVAKAATLINDNTEILFHRGDKFEMNAPIAIADRNVVIGAYGQGNRPILWRTEGNGASVISMWTNCVDVTVRDLVFDSPFTPVNGEADKIQVDGVVAGGTNITVTDCTFLNVNNAIEAARAPHGLLVQNSDAPLADGLRSYFIWGQGSDHVYLNNKVVNSTREHAVRTVGVERQLIANNDFGNTNRQTVDKEDFSKGSIEVHRGSYAYVSGNTVRDGALRTGPRGGETEEADAATDWVMIENNVVLNVSINLRAGTHHVMVRNNVINYEGNEAIKIYKPDVDGRTCSDITIDNNTAVNHQTKGKFLYLEGVAEGITLTHNLFIAPNLTAADSATTPVYVGMSDLSAFRSISGNIWPDAKGLPAAKGGVMYISPTWGTFTDFRSEAEWEAYEVVQGDKFENVPESQMYSMQIGSHTVGSTTRLAA